MNRQRLSLLVILVSVPVLVLLLLRRGGEGPEALADRMEEGRGHALGVQLAADFPGGGLVVLLEPGTLDSGRNRFADLVLAGLKSGAGSKFTFHRQSPRGTADVSLPPFLADRVAGNEHLGTVEDALKQHPGCVAVVARVDEAKPVPAAAVFRERAPLYALGYGDEAAWRPLLDSAVVRAVQIENLAGIATGTKSRRTADIAATYYRVVKKASPP